MDLHILPRTVYIGVNPHAPRKVCGTAICLHIDKIAPPSHTLANEKAEHAHIRKGKKIELFYLTEYDQRQRCGDNAAINGQTAVPDIQHFAQIQASPCVPEEVQIKHNVVQPRPYDRQGHGKKEKVDDIVGLDAKPRGHFIAEQHRQQKTGGNNDAVPVDGQTKELKGHPVQVELQPQTGKGHCPCHTFSPLGFTTERAVRSGDIQRRTQSSTSDLLIPSKTSGNRKNSSPVKWLWARPTQMFSKELSARTRPP